MIAFQDPCFWGTVNHHNQWSTALLSFLRLVRLTIKDSPPHHKTLISQLSVLVKMNKINHKSAKLVYNPTIYNAFKSTNGICIILEHWSPICNVGECQRWWMAPGIQISRTPGARDRGGRTCRLGLLPLSNYIISVYRSLGTGQGEPAAPTVHTVGPKKQVNEF